MWDNKNEQRPDVMSTLTTHSSRAAVIDVCHFTDREGQKRDKDTVVQHERKTAVCDRARENVTSSAASADPL